MAANMPKMAKIIIICPNHPVFYLILGFFSMWQNNMSKRYIIISKQKITWASNLVFINNLALCQHHVGIMLQHWKTLKNRSKLILIRVKQSSGRVFNE